MYTKHKHGEQYMLWSFRPLGLFETRSHALPLSHIDCNACPHIPSHVGSPQLMYFNMGLISTSCNEGRRDLRLKKSDWWLSANWTDSPVKMLLITAPQNIVLTTFCICFPQVMIQDITNLITMQSSQLEDKKCNNRHFGKFSFDQCKNDCPVAFHSNV